MSFLPYGRGAPGGWILSGATSLAIHAGLIAVLTVGVSEFFADREVPVARPEFQITLEQFDTLAMVGPELTDGSDEGLDGPDDAETVEEGDTLEPVEEGEDLAALDADAAEQIVAPDANTPEVDAAEEPDTAEPADTTDPVEAETPDAIEPEETEAVEADALDAQAAEEAQAADAETLDAEPLDGTEAAEAETLDAEPLDGTEAAEAETPDTREADVAEGEAVEALEGDPLDGADVAEVDALGAQDADVADTTALDALAPEDLAQTDTVEAPLAPEVDDLSAVLPDENAAIAPVETDPLLAEEGAAPFVAGEELDATQPVEQAVTPVIDGGTAAPVVTGGTAAAVAGAEALGEVPADEDFAALTPQASELPPVGGAEQVTPAAQPLAPVTDTAPPLGTVEPLDPVEPVAGGETEIEGSDVTPTRRKPRVPPTARDLAIGDLIQRIRANTTGDCVIALPRRDGEEGIGLALLAAEDGAMGSFADRVLTREGDADIRQTRTLVDERQCAALSYVAQNRDYPATRVGIRLDSAEVPSGNRVSGIMRGVAGRNLALFLVDNNGVVQDLERFLSTSGDFYRFEIPVTRVGPRRDTQQLLLAVASTESLAPLKQRSGQTAEDFFGALSNDLARQAALALVAFDVR